MPTLRGDGETRSSEPPLAHAQERARRVPGGRVGRAAGRHQHLPPDAERVADRARRLRGRRRRDARNGRALRGLLRDSEAAKRVRGDSTPGRRDSGRAAAVLTRGLPMQTDGLPVVVEGATAPAGRDAVPGVPPAIWAGPGYFDTLRIPILFGRALDERDRADTPRVAVISETMARQYFGAAIAAAPSAAASGSNGTPATTHGSRSSAWRPATSGRRSHRSAHRSCSTDRSRSGGCRRRPCSRGPRSMRPASSAPCSANCAP